MPRKACPSCYGKGERRYQGEAAPQDCRECGGSGKFSDYLSRFQGTRAQALRFYNIVLGGVDMKRVNGRNASIGKAALRPIPDATKLKIRMLHDRGWPSKKIQKRFRNYTVRQIGALRGWMRRGGLMNRKPA